MRILGGGRSTALILELSLRRWGRRGRTGRTTDDLVPDRVCAVWVRGRPILKGGPISSVRLIPFRLCHRLGLLQLLFAGENVVGPTRHRNKGLG
jgi:hypothetical protein